ncbi:methyltransferase type 11 [Mycolicibacterium mucogenicum]|uniref:Methyltransferase type 11 n=1 Tax=Mycolicibacterium mucogenicum TaxID=56689 RepID=A0A1A3HCI0_MYCMU|nr:methyltransferase domain-containing protein [Mycolicibacterium mucogenicum]OBJ45379.1 methyltransferase type 11 [Mycolicibacterium mucogenicum]
MSTPQEIKSCCAALYSSDAVAALLGESYHPGGAQLTRRLADLMHLQPGQRVLDVASGPGATARLLAIDYDVSVEGVDLAAPVVHQARQNTAVAGLAQRVHFHLGEAEHLPLPDDSVDAVISECAFCTFTDKPTAAGEFARVLRPGGRLGLADVITAPGGLPDDLVTLAGWVACVADARPHPYYTELFGDAGLHTVHVETCDDALVQMIDQIEARIHLLHITRALDAVGVDADQVLHYTTVARHAIAEGLLGYALILAEKGAGTGIR